MNNRREFDMPTPWWFKVWFAFCAALALSLTGFIVWAVYQLVVWVTAQ